MSSSAAAAAAAGEHDWEYLPLELLANISKHLFSIADRIRFAAVCKWWRSAVSPDTGNPRPLSLQKRPYLLLRDEDLSSIGQSDAFLFDVFGHPPSCHRIDPFPEIRGKWCIGSQFGWLITVDDESNPSLLNPFTRSEIHLPPITSLSDQVYPIYKHKDPSQIAAYKVRERRETPMATGFRTRPVKYFRRFCFRKLILSSSPASGNCTVVGIFNQYKTALVYARLGDTKWNLIDMNPKNNFYKMISDIIFRDGVLLALHHKGFVYAIDLEVASPTPKVQVGHRFGAGFKMRYLVDVSGELLQVLREVEQTYFGKSEYQFKTCHVEVRRLDPHSNGWLPVLNLRDHALFLGTCGSTAISPNDIAPGMKKNCIYFTDDNWECGDTPRGREAVRDVGVYDMRGDDIETIHPPNPRLNWPLPIWITPSAS